MASPLSNLSATLTHAVAYLTGPLIVSYPTATILTLQSILQANLTAHFASTWVPEEPLRGSGRRCLTLSPNCLPPRSIYSACLATGIQWFDWIAALGGCEFDFFIDPGCISIRFGKGSKLVTIWSEELFADAVSPVLPSYVKAQSQSKTIAQQLLENDTADDDEIFAMIADEVGAPTWATPVIDRFSPPARSESPLSAVSSDSRSSSSSGFSFVSNPRTDSCPSTSSRTSSSNKISRREKARQARVFVDTSKIEVTPYDGGKTTVLTGGVMLGAAPSKAKPTVSSWRRV